MDTVTKELEVDISFKNIEQQPVCSIVVSKAVLSDWIAMLWMLLEEMGSVVIAGKTKSRCVISLGDTTSIIEDNRTLRITLSSTDLAFTGAYLLRFYRYGLAEVDHVDLEAISGDNCGYITFKVEEFMAPVSEMEARHRLEL